MKQLPQWDYTPSPDAGLCLAGLALVLSPLLAAIGHHGMSHHVTVLSFVKDGVDYTMRSIPFWTEVVDISLPLAAVTALILLGRISRHDVGLTLGKPAVSFFWIAVGIAVEVAVRLSEVVVLIVWFRLSGWTVPAEMLKPAQLHTIEFLAPLLWRQCLTGPLGEELLFRGITVPALERIGGPWLAVIGSSVIWTAAHYMVPAPAPITAQTLAQMAVLVGSGMLWAWIFLKTRSLFVVIILHCVANALWSLQELILLCYPDFVRSLFVGN
jgi:membrane protease YdiL (CAAX protease family)